MAQLIRSAKSASDWTARELYAYNISITPTSPANFFQPGADPSLDHLDPSILTATDSLYPNLSEATSDYLGYLDLATYAYQESAINDFAAATLKLLGFRAPNTTVAIRYSIPLTICGEERDAETDTIFDNTAAVEVEAKAPVVAEAIAAFQFNNAKRVENGLPTLEAMTIPCITMSGTTPTFYLVPVTKELSDAVMTGQYPTSQTQVLMCSTTAIHPRRVSNGMADLEFRKIALKCFLAFKDLAKSYWQYMV